MGIEFDFSQLEQKLVELGNRAGKELTDNALKAGAQVLLAEQLQVVPRDTGALADSLIIGKIKGTGVKRKILVGIDPARAEAVRYGFYQEYGTDVMLGKKWMKKSWTQSARKANIKIGESLARDLGGL